MKRFTIGAIMASLAVIAAGCAPVGVVGPLNVANAPGGGFTGFANFNCGLAGQFSVSGSGSTIHVINAPTTAALTGGPYVYELNGTSIVFAADYQSFVLTEAAGGSVNCSRS